MATLKRWDGTGFVDLTTLKRWDGTAFVSLTVAKRWDGTAFVDIPLGGGGGSLQATVAPGAAIGAVTSGNLWAVVTSNAVTVTPAGGTGPYTYLWSRVSGDSAPTPSSKTTASVTFSATIGRDQERNAVWKCVITDALAATTEITVPVNLFHNSTL